MRSFAFSSFTFLFFFYFNVSAHAGFVSTAGTSFTPVTFDGSGPQSLNIDLNGDGVTDFAISGALNVSSFGNIATVNNPLTITSDINSVYVQDFFDDFNNLVDRVIGFSDLSFSTPPGNLQNSPGLGFQTGTAIIAFQPNGGLSNFVFLGPASPTSPALNPGFFQPSPGSHDGFIEVELLDPRTNNPTLGYIAGTYFDGTTASGDSTFTVNDFGLEVAVAEPASLALLGTGLLGLGLRRRRKLS